MRLTVSSSLIESHHTKHGLTRESLISLILSLITGHSQSHSLTPLYAKHRGESETRHETETGAEWPNPSSSRSDGAPYWC
jgi:hypothetical protein